MYPLLQYIVFSDLRNTARAVQVFFALANSKASETESARVRPQYLSRVPDVNSVCSV